MSEGKAFPLLIAASFAETVIEILKPHCERIEIAGSIRRKKPRLEITVQDIEEGKE